MNDKDYIKELFQKELGSHEVKVDPQLWNGVQAQLGNIASTTATGSAAVAGKASLFVKIGIAAAITSAAIVTTYVLVTNAENPTEPALTELVEVNTDTVESPDLKLENNTVQENTLTKNTLTENTSPTTAETEALQEPTSFNNFTVSDPDRSSETPILDMESSANNVPPVQTKVNKGEEGNTPPSTSDDTTSPLQLSIGFEKKSNQHYLFSAEVKDADRIEWDFGDGTGYSDEIAEHIFNKSGTFTVTASAYRNNEMVQEIMSITIDVEGKIIKLPTVFSPNNDGSNDEFFIESEGLLDFSAVIMNSKGEILFESTDPNFRWDGSNRITGLRAEEGYYFYIIIAKDALGNSISEHQRLELKK